MTEFKLSGTRTIPFLMVSSTDHINGITGRTPTVTIMKEGGAFAAPVGAVTEVGYGWYRLAPTSADTNTLGTLVLKATATGADPVDDRHKIVAYDPEDAAGLGLSRVDASINSRLATAGYLAPDNATIGTIQAKTTNLPAAPAAVSDIPTATANADALLDRASGVEAGLTVRQWLRLGGSVLFGKASGLATNTPAYRDFGDTKPRVSATTDAYGNRTAVTRDAT